tara:strand:- start:187 stop:300 length:114 start_codon:yes stop_codon:yes gene_type:complete
MTAKVENPPTIENAIPMFSKTEYIIFTKKQNTGYPGK